MLLREVKRATDCSILSKIRIGVCDEEVTKENIELERTMVICNTRKECEEINSACIENLEGSEVIYESLDTDHQWVPTP